MCYIFKLKLFSWISVILYIFENNNWSVASFKCIRISLNYKSRQVKVYRLRVSKQTYDHWGLWAALWRTCFLEIISNFTLINICIFCQIFYFFYWGFFFVTVITLPKIARKSLCQNYSAKYLSRVTLSPTKLTYPNHPTVKYLMPWYIQTHPPLSPLHLQGPTQALGVNLRCRTYHAKTP